MQFEFWEAIFNTIGTCIIFCSSIEPSPTISPSGQTQEELSEEALIAAVNESAEEGIAFFTNLLGITFGGGESSGNTTDANITTETTTPNEAAEHTPLA